MKKNRTLFLLILALFLVFSSCENEKKSCEELLLIAAEYGIDNYSENGYMFLKSADESSSFYMSEMQKRTLYSERFLTALNGVKDYACFLSSADPYEIAIFECYSRDETDEILKMCYERADVLKVGLRFTKWEEASKWINLFTYRKYVIFIFTESAELNDAIEDILIKSLK